MIKPNFLYKNPKVASTSLHKYLTDIGMYSDDQQSGLINSEGHAFDGGDPVHWPYPPKMSQIAMSFFNKCSWSESVYKWTVVRNPWSRVFSAYKQAVKSGWIAPTKYDFNDFVKNLFSHNFWHGHNCSCKVHEITALLDPINEPESQDSMVYGAPGALELIHSCNLLTARHLAPLVPSCIFVYPIKFDKICKIENLQKDFQQVCEETRIPYNNIPFLNVDQNPESYQKHYNSNSKKLIEKFYKLDIEYFKYRF